MSPALIPNPETYKDNMENSEVKDRYLKAPGYKYPRKFDEFSYLKNGHGLDKYRNRSSPILEVFGCHACRWINTELCPHKGDVTHMKHHAKGICSQRLTIPKQLHDEGVPMTGKQMLQVRGLMDAEYFSKYVQEAALSGKRDINDVFPWEKLKADILKDMRKQDEGSKLNISKNNAPDPVAMGELMRLAREKNITGSVEVKGDGLQEQAKEKMSEDNDGVWDDEEDS